MAVFTTSGSSSRCYPRSFDAVGPSLLSVLLWATLAPLGDVVLAIANRQNLADQEQQRLDEVDELEGMGPTPCGSRSKDDPTRYCISEVGHSGRHWYRRMNALVN